MTSFSLNIKQRLVEFNRPAVMGIINVTPDSFYPSSRTFDDEDIASRVRSMLDEKVDIIDLGAYSSRPGADDVSPEEESSRLKRALGIIRDIAPAELPISIDTFRASVAQKAVEDWGADIVNDISGGNLDPDMAATVAALHAPYILMHMRGTPADMQQRTDYVNVTADVLAELGERISRFALEGVADIIVDPGFGFSKTLQQNYQLVRDLKLFGMFHRPLLVGFSRKSMISKLLGIDSSHALNATTVLNTLALTCGASILRVHDVAAARQAVDIYCASQSPASIVPAL